MATEDGDNGGGNGDITITATQVSLGADATTTLYQGTISTLNGGYMVAQLNAIQSGQPPLQLTINVQAQGDNVSGTVSGTPLVAVP